MNHEKYNQVHIHPLLWYPICSTDSQSYHDQNNNAANHLILYRNNFIYTEITSYYTEITLFYTDITLFHTEITLFYTEITSFHTEITLFTPK